METGIVLVPFGVGVAETIGADPLRPAGIHGDTGACRNFAIGGDPRLDVVRRHLGIGGVGGASGDIDYANGATRLSTANSATDLPFSEKCSGASM